MSTRRDFLKKTAVVSAVGLTGTALFFAGSMERGNTQQVPPLRLGIIGTGARGQDLINISQRSGAFEIMGICDTLPFRLDEASKLAPGATRHTDYRHLLDDPTVDAVIIATPFHLHAQPLIDTLAAGKDVYCEKTAVKGYEQIESVRQAARDSDRIVQVGYQWRHSRLYEHVVNLIHAGELGEVSHIECHWNRNGDWRRPVPSPELERVINWRMYREYSGGLTAELSSHQMEFCNWLLGERPTQIMGTGGIDYWQDGREVRDHQQLLVSYPSGIDASFTCLTANASPGYRIKIQGSKATVMLGFTEAWWSWEKDEDSELEVDAVSGATVVPGLGKAHRIELEHNDPVLQALLDFGSSTRTRERPRSNLDTGLVVAEMVQKSLDAMDNERVERFV